MAAIYDAMLYTSNYNDNIKHIRTSTMRIYMLFYTEKQGEKKSDILYIGAYKMQFYSVYMQQIDSNKRNGVDSYGWQKNGNILRSRT